MTDSISSEDQRRNPVVTSSPMIPMIPTMSSNPSNPMDERAMSFRIHGIRMRETSAGGFLESAVRDFGASGETVARTLWRWRLGRRYRTCTVLFAGYPFERLSKVVGGRFTDRV